MARDLLTQRDVGKAMQIPHNLIHRRRHAAFSMIELMIVLAIAAILTVIAVPNFKQTIDRQKITTASSDLYAAIGLSRAEAIRRGTQVDLDAISGNWENGWSISVPSSSGPAERVYTHVSVPTTVKVDAPVFGTALSYDGTGRARLASDSQVVLSGFWTFTISNNPAYTRKVKINAVGRPQLCNPSVDPSC